MDVHRIGRQVEGGGDRVSTTTFSLAASGASLSGGWTATADAGGHNARQIHGQNSEIEGKFTGTQLEYFGYITGATDYQISIDGGDFSQVTAVLLNDWQWNTMVTGLSDALHSFILQQINGAGNDYVDVDTSFRVTGGSPAMSADSAYSPALGFVENSSLFVAKGCPPFGSGRFDIYYNINRPDVLVGFFATTTTIRLWCWQLGGTFHLRTDGVDGGIITMPNTSLGGWVTVTTGADGGAQHLYEIISDYLPGGNPGNVIIWGVSLAGGTLGATAPATTDNIGLYGDSITFGVGATNNLTAWAYLLGKSTGLGIANRGMPSTTVHDFGSNPNPGETRTADITGLSPAVTQIIILYGTNDWSQAVAPETLAQFLASNVAMFNKLIAGTAVPLFALLLLKRTDLSDASRDLWNAQITAAQAACTTPSRITIADTTSWIDTVTDLADSTHPNDAGHAKIAARVQSLLAPSSNPTLLGMGFFLP